MNPSNDEYIALIEEYRKTNSDVIFNKILKSLEDFIYKIMHNMNCGFDRIKEDAVCAAAEVLWQVTKTYDPKQNVKFISYFGNALSKRFIDLRSVFYGATRRVRKTKVGKEIGVSQYWGLLHNDPRFNLGQNEAYHDWDDWSFSFKSTIPKYDDTNNPLEDREAMLKLWKEMSPIFTPRERAIIRCLLSTNGAISYLAITQQTGMTTKAVDNAVQRIKAKVKMREKMLHANKK